MGRKWPSFKKMLLNGYGYCRSAHIYCSLIHSSKYLATSINFGPFKTALCVFRVAGSSDQEERGDRTLYIK